jgi:hypothetical protein
MYRRQLDGCTTPCASVARALGCNSTECACSILNSAEPATIDTCVNCLEPAQPLIASNITLFANICSKCQSQCSLTLTAYIKTLSCNTTTCFCSKFSSVPASAITSCASCAQSFDPVHVSGLLILAQQCGILPPTGTAASPGPSPTTSTKTGQSGATSGTGTTKPTSSASISAVGQGRPDLLFSGLFWMALILGSLAFPFLLV